MSTVFKTLLNDDVVSTRTLLFENIPITGTIGSGTYNDSNIKNFSHGRFQSVYDYPFLSSSANHIYDLSIGLSPQSPLSSSATVENSKKLQMYNQMAQTLVGHDINGRILEIDQDGDMLAGGAKLRETFVFSFSRLLVKDEIKKGSFVMTVGDGAYNTPFTLTRSFGDYGAQNDFRVNSPSGEYGFLYTSSVTAVNASSSVGIVYYQAGIVILTGSLFTNAAFHQNATLGGVPQTVDQAVSGATIQDVSNTIRRRIYNTTFNNTVELNSTIYFCRANHNEFNYSANPTYLSGSKIRVKNSTIDAPVSYITTVGLYSADSELLAVAKVSEPLRKDPTNELILRVRLDY